MAKKKQVKAKSGFVARKKAEGEESRVAIPKLPRAFSVADNFTEGGPGPFSFVDDDLGRFYGKAVPPRSGYALISRTLAEDMDDKGARAILSGAGATDLAAISHLISLQPNGGKAGALSVKKGEANCFLLPGGRAEAVWEGNGWGLWTFKGKLSDHLKWPKGTRFFCRPRA